jgi:integrase
MLLTLIRGSMVLATIRKQRGKWQAQIRLKGIKPIAKSFAKKSDAVKWSRVIESRVTLGSYIDPRAAENTLVSDVIDRYLEQRNKHHKGDASLKSRCKRLRGDLGAYSLAKLSVCHLAKYRGQRLEVVSGQTVKHELSLLRAILRLAATDWEIPFPQGIPTIRLPRMPKGRTRRLKAGEEERLLSLCGDDAVLRDFILLALESAMRRSELIAMKWSDIDWESSTLSIPKTKTGVPRVIPLSRNALSILKAMDRSEGCVFDITATRVSQKFARVCRKAGIKDLHLHDLRHEAVSRLFELGLNQMEVAAISGHQAVSMLQRYTHISVEHLAKRLAG